MSMMMMGNRARMTYPKQTMAQFAEWLVGQLDRPVVDQTGLTKKYDLSLEYSPESVGGMAEARWETAGFRPWLVAGTVVGGDGEEARAGRPPANSAPTLFAALQEQLGLKLEQKKGPVDLIVVDHAEKNPTEN